MLIKVHKAYTMWELLQRDKGQLGITYIFYFIFLLNNEKNHTLQIQDAWYKQFLEHSLNIFFEIYLEIITRIYSYL